MSKEQVWSGKLDCTFHGKMHWELNEQLWFLSEAASQHHGIWKEMGVKITHAKGSSKSKVYAPKGYDEDDSIITVVDYCGMDIYQLYQLYVCDICDICDIYEYM